MNFLTKCCAGLPEVGLDPGTVLLTEADKSGKLYILIEGEVAVLRGDITVATISEPGAVFGEMSLLLDVPHTASVKVLRPSRAYVVENAETFLQSAPEIMRHIATLLALRLQSATGYLADLKRQFAENRDHLGMIDEVLESLLHQQNSEFSPGPGREFDPRL
jgi:CRP/FNR family transcriptional regulator, cyclic AMP receptor protein